MKPLTGVVFGSIIGAAAVALRGTQIAQHARPVAKSMLKAVLAAVHEAQVRQAEIVEAAEDLFAETTADVEAEKLASVLAAARAKAEEATEALKEAQLRQAEIVAAIEDLYAHAKEKVTPEQLAAAVAAAEAKAREAIEAAKSGQSGTNSTEGVVDLSSAKYSPAGRSSNG